MPNEQHLQRPTALNSNSLFSCIGLIITPPAHVYTSGYTGQIPSADGSNAGAFPMGFHPFLRLLDVLISSYTSK